MKTKADSDFVMIRSKRNSPTRVDFSIVRNNEKLDLTDLRYMRTQENGVEEWVHVEDYEHYYNAYLKFDSLKEWYDSEDHKEFVKDISKQYITENDED